jgi:hypothetical protein
MHTVHMAHTQLCSHTSIIDIHMLAHTGTHRVPTFPIQYLQTLLHALLRTHTFTNSHTYRQRLCLTQKHNTGTLSQLLPITG